MSPQAVARPLLPDAPLPPGDRYADVAVDAGPGAPEQLFTYAPPVGEVVRPGHRVRVPFGSRGSLPGVVFALRDAPPPGTRLRRIAEVLDPEPLLGPVELELAQWLADVAICPLGSAVRPLLPPPGEALRPEPVYAPSAGAPVDDAALARAPAQRAAWQVLRAEPGLTRAAYLARGVRPGAIAALLARGWLELGAATRRRDPFATPLPVAASPPAPTPEQAEALKALAPFLQRPRHGAFLLWGVTGSGKTEIYLRAIADVLAAGRQALVLVPEIALTPQTVSLFRGRFGAAVAVLHSGLGAGERHDEWWRIRRGEVTVAVGARSAVFAPFQRLGLIVVDEEHESSYKQEETPRYHARDVALWRGRRLGIPVVLGSATPDVETYAAAATSEVVRLDLRQRVLGRPLPTVRLVDMATEPPGTLLGQALAGAMADHLARGRQVLLFLNRRGYAPVLLCRDCRYLARCQQCSVSLSYHAADRQLHCHYCAAVRPVPARCPGCGGPWLQLRGSGTERVAEEVARRFPRARLLRMDLDTTGSKGAHERIYEGFRSGAADVLIGTQMVAKGWDVAGVTLVGVVDADTALHHPDYRAPERTFQLLCQVAGRAGRGGDPGEVIVQTRTPAHPAVVRAAHHDYAAFASDILEQRRGAGFPPYGRLIRLLVWSRQAAAAQSGAQRLAAALAPRLPAGVDLWGPSVAPLAQLRGQHRWHLCLRGPLDAAGGMRHAARMALRDVAGRLGMARAAADPDPQSML